MPRFFLHLRDGKDVILDDEGSEIPLPEVAAVTLKSARDCMVSDIRQGTIDLRMRIDVVDEAGVTVHSLSFASAVMIIPPEGL